MKKLKRDFNVNVTGVVDGVQLARERGILASGTRASLEIIVELLLKLCAPKDLRLSD